MGEERIASLDALGFDWRLNSTRTYNKPIPFEKKIEGLMIHKEKHAHLIVMLKEDNTIAVLCTKIRYARKNPGQVGIIKLNEDRIESLDAVGFVWRLNDACSNTSFEEMVSRRSEDTQRKAWESQCSAQGR